MADEETTSTPTPAAEQTATPPNSAEATMAKPEAVTAPTEPEAMQSEPQPAEPQTAQMGRSEPIGSESAPVDGPLASQPEPLSPEPAGQATKSTDSVQDTRSADSPAPAQNSPPISKTVQHLGRDVLVKARAMIQARKKNKLEKIMTELEKNGKITNDEVEKLLHVSDATATRYLSALEKDGKIKQVGKTGIGVVYEKI